MDPRQLNMKSSVLDLCTQYPRLPGILRDIGFTDIVKPGMLQTVGRFMTIPKGAKLKKIDIQRVVAALEKAGFTVTGLDQPDS